MRNHQLLYRPLRGGIRIYNPAVNEPGTLGFIATADGRDRWIVSCHHVLCGGPSSEAIYQPIDEPENIVAFTDPARSRADLDCAAARVADAVDAVPELLGIGTPTLPAAPEEGMLVIKSGAATGVTEGVITEVRAGRVEIEPAGLPEEYQLSDAGDSGALWVVKGSLAPVALHQGGSARPRCFAYGIPVLDVLRELKLAMPPLARPAVTP